MKTFKTEYIAKKIKGREILIIKKENYESFNEGLLGLGKIEVDSHQVDALCVIFDLEGFTNFCKQIDPQLAIPEYLNLFIKWIFNEIKVELTIKKHREGYETWADLPFLSKFMGDGILFLWDTKRLNDNQIQNFIVSMYKICRKYTTKFLPEIIKDIVSPPAKLRCGIARGAIYSVRNGNDYVGPCINVAARLQKLNSLSFAFSRRGIDPEEITGKYSKLFIVKKVDIRGIGNSELVCILKSEFARLDKIEKTKFRE